MLLNSVRQRVLLWIVALLLLFAMFSFSASFSPVFAGGECVDTGCSG